MMKGKIIGPFKELITLERAPLRGRLSSSDITCIGNGGIVVDDQGKIVATGVFETLRKNYSDLTVEYIADQLVALPGFIDSHTHICWASDRATDYAMRLEGKTYLEIAASGGGIWSSVVTTRDADENSLINGIFNRAQGHFSEGVTTIEVKSGYGLNKEAEIKILNAIKSADERSRADLIPTCLAAHMKPHDFSGSNLDYLNFLLEGLLPEIRERRLSDRIDIFIEQTAFLPDEGLYYLQKAREMGFQLTVHADQFTTGGSEAGILSGALSVDHLEASTPEEIKKIADADITATILPGASLGLGMPFAPARRLLDAGAIVAIASDWNPGSAPMGDLLVQVSLLGAYEKLSIAETLAGITFRAAHALALNDRGRLATGEWADIQDYREKDYTEIFYHQGKLKPSKVWKRGEI